VAAAASAWERASHRCRWGWLSCSQRRTPPVQACADAGWYGPHRSRSRRRAPIAPARPPRTRHEPTAPRTTRTAGADERCPRLPRRRGPCGFSPAPDALGIADECPTPLQSIPRPRSGGVANLIARVDALVAGTRWTNDPGRFTPRRDGRRASLAAPGFARLLPRPLRSASARVRQSLALRSSQRIREWEPSRCAASAPPIALGGPATTSALPAPAYVHAYVQIRARRDGASTRSRCCETPSISRTAIPRRAAAHPRRWGRRWVMVRHGLPPASPRPRRRTGGGA